MRRKYDSRKKGLKILQNKYCQLCSIYIKIEYFIGILNLRIFFSKEIRLNYAILDLPKKCPLLLAFSDLSRERLCTLLLKFYWGRRILIKLMYGLWALFFLNLRREGLLSMLRIFRVCNQRYCTIQLSFHKACPLTFEI